ncbi:MAG: phage gp6-like head-tail connector protein [Mesorhizobium sp.]|nr:head-tail connector protein [Mesorhizobium sp.]MBN9242436.1 phage gp6-like head-tail connector protein [Mesorhizobium sp.]
MLAPVRTVAPSVAPVSLVEAKLHLRVDHSDDDTLISSLIDAATAYLDGWSGILGRALVTQTWRQDFCRFSACMRLPLAPVASIEKVEYFDGENARQTLDADVYMMLADARGPYLNLASGKSWPGVYSRDDAVSITFVAGYGAAAAVPAPIRTAIMLFVRDMYTSTAAVGVVKRETVEGVSTTEYQDMTAGLESNPVASMLLAPYRRVGV